MTTKLSHWRPQKPEIVIPNCQISEHTAKLKADKLISMARKDFSYRVGLLLTRIQYNEGQKSRFKKLVRHTEDLLSHYIIDGKLHKLDAKTYWCFLFAPCRLSNRYRIYLAFLSNDDFLWREQILDISEHAIIRYVMRSRPGVFGLTKIKADVEQNVIPHILDDQGINEVSKGIIENGHHFIIKNNVLVTYINKNLAA